MPHRCQCSCGNQVASEADELSLVQATTMLFTEACGDRMKVSSQFHLAQCFKAFVEPVALKTVIEKSYGLEGKIIVRTFPFETSITATASESFRD
jgi:hypothetical protein